MTDIKNIKLNGTKLPIGGSGGSGKVFEDVETIPSTPDSNVIYRVLSPVPNTGTIDKVYFNTGLSIEQVKEQLSKLTYTGTDYMSFLLTQQTEHKIFLIAASMVGGECGIACMNIDANGETMTVLFTTSIEFAAKFGETINYTGWNPSFNGIVEIDSSIELIPNVDEDLIGVENDKITSLFNTGIKYVNVNNSIEFEFANKKEVGSDDSSFFNIDVYGTINNLEDKVKEVKFTYDEANKIYQSKSIILRLFVYQGVLGVHIWSYILDQGAVTKLGTDSHGDPYYEYIFKFIKLSYTGNIDDPRIRCNLITLQGTYENEGTGITVDNLTDDHYLDILISGGSSVTVDTVMSASSTNPVQNKVIKDYVDNAIASQSLTAGEGIKIVDGVISLTYANGDEEEF